MKSVIIQISCGYGQTKYYAILQKVLSNYLLLQVMSLDNEMQFMSNCINIYHLTTVIFIYSSQTNSV